MARSSQLSLQELSDRIVPATLLRLTTPGAEAVASGALLQQLVTQPAAGTYDPFVRIQGAGNTGGIQQGYNTSARPLQFDERPNIDFTHNLQLSQVPIVTIGGTAYREFLLDVNQKNGAAKLSVEEIHIFTDPRGSLAAFQNKTNTFAGQQAKFNLDAGGDVTIVLNDNVNPDTGYGDMRLLVPASNFTGVANSDFVYVYSKMGGLHDANGGAEEWAVRTNVVPPPPPPTGTSSLSGGVYFDEFQDQQADGLYFGIEGVPINLIGVDSMGNQIYNLTINTDENGSYQFTNLPNGIYTITQVQSPSDYNGTPLEDGPDYPGSLGGGFGEDNESIINIEVFDDQHGVGYDFTELFGGSGN
jgi:hypothetical protein